jgi:hypothetical protein
MNPANYRAMMRFCVRLGQPVGTWALLVIAAIALLFSVLFERSSIATVATLALYLVFDYWPGRIL